MCEQHSCLFFRCCVRAVFFAHHAISGSVESAHQKQDVEARVHSQHSWSGSWYQRRLRWTSLRQHLLDRSRCTKSLTTAELAWMILGNRWEWDRYDILCCKVLICYATCSGLPTICNDFIYFVDFYLGKFIAAMSCYILRHWRKHFKLVIYVLCLFTIGWFLQKKNRHCYPCNKENIAFGLSVQLS